MKNTILAAVLTTAAAVLLGMWALSRPSGPPDGGAGPAAATSPIPPAKAIKHPAPTATATGASSSAPVTTTSAPVTPLPVASLPAAGTWPMFRGNQAMLGNAPGKLGDSFTQLWKFETKGLIRGSPVVADGKVFIGDSDGKLYALDLATGNVVWKYATEGAIEAPPLFLAGVVYIGATDKFLHAVDAAKGELKWKVEFPTPITNACNWAVNAKGKTMIVADGSDNLMHCLDAATGEAEWAFEAGNYIYSPPAVAGGRVCFGGCDMVVHVVGIDSGEESTSIPAQAYVTSAAAICGDEVYFGDQGPFLYRGDAATGKLVWTFEGEGPCGAPALTEQCVLAGSKDMNLYCLERKSGRKLWNFTANGAIDGGPVVCGDKVVCASSDGRWYVLSLKDGSRLFSKEIGESITTTPAVVNGVVVIAADGGFVYAFGPK
jgi:outer membrane protein assembly factor BamB